MHSVAAAGASATTHLVVGGAGGGGARGGGGGGRVQPLDLEGSAEQRPEQAQERLVAHRRVLQHIVPVLYYTHDDTG